MDIFEKIMPDEYRIHDNMEKHAAFTSMLVLGMGLGAILTVIFLTVLSVILNLF